MSEGHWVKGIADEIIGRGDEKIVVHTGKTPSGPIHIGAEREQFICSAIQRELTRRGLESTFNFIIDSYDPIKSIPVGVKVPIGFEENIGKPLSDVPDPLGCHESYAVHYADEFVQCQSRLGLSPNVIYSHVLYQQKEMKDVIRTVLARLDELRIIRKRFIQEEGENSADDWNPVMVVCNNCGKIASKKKEVAPNRVTSWDLRKDEVSYLCTNCGYQGTGSISGTRLKLSWRVDWAAKWAVFKVTCEPAGKDHCVKDGAYDMGLEVCSKIFGYRGPLRVSYEWLTLGDRAMKTHKGITFTPTEWLRIAPPEPLRYLILSADLMRHVSFLPERIPDLVDNFDRLERIYYGSEPPSGNESIKYMRDLYEICTVTNHSSQPGRIPYRFCVYMVQLEGLFTSGGIISKSADYLSKLIGRPATEEEREDMRARLTNAKNWVESYAPPNLKFQISTEAPSYKPKSDEERAFIGAVIKLLEKDLKEDDLQNEIFNVARSLGLEIGEAFSLIYRILLGSERGPRLAPLLMTLDRDWLLDRLRSVI